MNKISQKDYVSIFTQYGVKDRNFIQPVINKCINELGKENLKVIKTNEGSILDHKKEKDFLKMRQIEKKYFDSING